MKKINSIKFKNFKAFYQEQTIQLDGKNLLVYGENGSGKSSIFWGLYTFLQSTTKEQPDIFKYFVDFDDANPVSYDSLKNIFATAAEDAYIELSTKDTVSGSITVDKIDAHATSTDKAKNNLLISKANASSDFINYKLLHNFYNVTHKQEINLWQVFLRDIFPLFRNNEAEKYYAERIAEITADVPRASGNRISSIGSRPQVEFNDKITVLNNEIQIFLSQIEQNANQFLRNHFYDGTDAMRLQLIYTVKIDYDTIRNKKTDGYQIGLLLELKDEISGTWKQVKRPHSFLNEAQLTRVAIAVRIGALQTRLQNTDYQVLCLDDMLISLDMGNRDKVIQTFLNTGRKPELEFFDKFQKLIFTHDKAFYNLCKQRIRLNLNEQDWHFKEIYLDTDKTPHRPYIDNGTDYFQRAEKHMKAFDYPASANALRQGLENLVFESLPNYLRLTKERKGEEITVPKQFNDLLEGLKTLHKVFGVDVAAINDLFVYKDTLLNPLSHNNLDTPVYREELQRVLKTIPSLKILELTVLKELGSGQTMIKFVDTKQDTGEVITYHIELKENLLQYTLLDGDKYLSRSRIFVHKLVSSNGTEMVRNKEYKSLKEYSAKIAHYLGTAYASDNDILAKIIFV
ncbi:AAA family ATPase [Pedobacter paludis]|uniref:AAA family ATPase n=1 Tax=Pedobacter paludis TaxID=2203212 RepID=UPI001314E743|nr:AAA family ATPase [Pedobacter paludis]